MAYQLVYQGDFCNKSGDTIYVDILRRSDNPFIVKRIIFAGEDQTPIKISYKDTSDLKNTPLNGSECILNIKAVGDFELSSMYAADEKEWQVNISGAWKWSGYIIPDSCSEPFMPKPYDVSIQATDGLGTLKDLPFSADLGVLYKGFYSEYDLLRLALAKTGVGLGLLIGINQYESAMVATKSPLVQAFKNAARYRTSDLSAFSCEEVIRSILAQYQARLHQFNGYWQIVSSWELSRGDVKAWVFPYGQNDSSGTIQLVNTITGGGSNRSVRPVGDKQLGKGILSSTAYYQYGYISNQLFNGNMDTWSTAPNGLPDGWVTFGSTTVQAFTRTRDVNGQLTTDYLIEVRDDGQGGVMNTNEVQILANDTGTISFDLYAPSGVSGSSNRNNYISVLVKDQSGKYLTTDGWRSEYGYYVVQKNKTEFINQMNISFDLPPQANDYKIIVGVLVVGDAGGSHFWTKINNWNVSSGKDSAIRQSLGAFNRQTQLTNQTYVPDPILLLQSDDNNSQRTSQILIGSPTGIPSTAWTAPGIASNDLLHVVANIFLRMHSRPYTIVQFDFYGYGVVDINTILSVDLIAGNMLFLSGDFDLKKDVHSLRFAQILVDDTSYTEERREDYGSLTGSDGVSVGSPGGVTLPNGSVSGIDSDSFIKNQDTYQTNARFNVKKGIFQETLIVPTVTPPVLDSAQAAIWIGALSGITNAPGGGGSDYVLPIASAGVLGGVKIGSGISITSDGTISVNIVDLSNYYTKSESDGRFLALHGTADNSSAWVGQVYDGASDTAVNTYIMAYGADGKWHKSGKGNINTFLGMPAGGDTLQSVVERGNTSTNSIGITSEGAPHDPYGIMSVTRSYDQLNKSYYGMTKAGQIGWGMGIGADNSIIWGTGSTLSNGGVFSDVAASLTTGGHFRAPYFEASSQFQNYGSGYKSFNYKGMVGNYDAQGNADMIIWTIGDTWNEIANMYGIGYSFNNNLRGGQHQIVIRNNGQPQITLGMDGYAYFNTAVASPIGDFRDTLMVPSISPNYLSAGRAAIWIGSLSGITN